MRTTFADIQQRVADFIETLRVEEKRPVAEIVEDLATPNNDIVRARILGRGHETLPLEAGVSAFSLFRDALLAAACAAWSPRGLYGPRKPQPALQFVRDARLGQTQRGSYVLMALSPVLPQLATPALFDTEDEPFSRRALRTLAAALQATLVGIRKAAATGRIDALASAVPQGVSANLCDALAGLNRLSENQGVEFSFSWAPARKPVDQTPSRLLLPEDATPYLEEAARIFRYTATLEEVEFFGVVHRLEDAGNATSKVTLTGTVDGERRTVLTELSGDLNTQAIRAYEDRAAIACVGDLHKEGKYWWLKNPRGFRLLDGDL